MHLQPGLPTLHPSKDQKIFLIHCILTQCVMYNAEAFLDSISNIFAYHPLSSLIRPPSEDPPVFLPFRTLIRPPSKDPPVFLLLRNVPHSILNTLRVSYLILLYPSTLERPTHLPFVCNTPNSTQILVRPVPLCALLTLLLILNTLLGLFVELATTKVIGRRTLPFIGALALGGNQGPNYWTPELRESM